MRDAERRRLVAELARFDTMGPVTGDRHRNVVLRTQMQALRALWDGLLTSQTESRPGRCSRAR